MPPIPQITPYTSLIAFVIGLPTALATYYQAWKARQENKDARRGYVYSRNCLEFVLLDGTSVNLVPLETLHSLPKPGDIVLLPGAENDEVGELAPSAYRIGRVEHIYARVGTARAQAGQARLVKAVAFVESLVERPSESQFRHERDRIPATIDLQQIN